ncbi:hypothetical protein GOP47_0014685 [Adiantum capillus-veneris]|uniref:Uncharacterized protein n=1 Tax=Adiantum capillus-veneris TaxID=13818 RepID=A0A9D4ZDQ8_ADICA|nr:hypothetical protein GOP47_0014685 [Adiantum capillus-veneris]
MERGLTLTEEEACVKTWELMYASTLPMLLRAACELGIPELLHAEPGGLSAPQIAQRLQEKAISTSQPLSAAHHLDRILRCLAAHGVFKTSHSDTINLYLPSPLSKWLLPQAPSLRPLLMFLTSPHLLLPWLHLTPFLSLGPPEPFHRAHSLPLWDYALSHPPFASLLHDAMSSDTISLSALLSHYHDFAHIHTLVDVGGGIGTAAAHIASVYPSIRVICFDLPHVIAMAPSNPGVEFVEGDMFQKIPKGDAIFMKWVLHDWSDDDCIKILKNCHNALLKYGKLIIMDAVLETSGNGEHKYNKLRTLLDVSMMAGTKGGKERTKFEWELLLREANFSLQKVIDLPCPQSIIEAIPLSNALTN